MLHKKWHVNVSNIVDFMTKNMIFRKETNIFNKIIFCLAIIVLKIQSFDLT